MAANVYEWNESDWYGAQTGNGIRGGAFWPTHDYMHAADRGYGNSDWGYERVGLRIAEVPEPATLFVMAAAGLAILRRQSKIP